MNKFVHFSFIITVAFSITGCANFRINMSANYGPNTPPKPPPSGFAKEWVDVQNWQLFLVMNGKLKAGQYKSNTFDLATAIATRGFQTTPGKIATYVLPGTGCVNYATYRKAVQEGMLPFKPIRVVDPCALFPLPPYTVRSRDYFYTANLHYLCKDVAPRHDVQDWQRFLVDNGYLALNNYTAGTFGSTTKTATMAFQNAWRITAVGYVEHVTWVEANTFSSVTGGLGESLMGMDGAGTVEDPTNCHQ